MVSVMTFIGRVEGLDAPTLHAQYFEEYLLLSRHVDHLKVVTDTVVSRRLDTPPNMEIVKLPAIRIPKIYGATKILFYGFKPVLDRDNVDVLYVRTFSPPELSALWFGRLFSDIPSVLVLPGTWLFGHPSSAKGKERFYRWFLRRALDSCEKIVLYSRHMLPEVLLYHPKLDVSKVVYIHNAVNIVRFSPEGEKSKRLEELKRGRKCILYVGRVNEKKGVEDLVKAFRIVSTMHRDCILAIAGAGEAGYVEKLLEEVNKTGLDDSVFFLGPVPNSEIPMLYRSADVVAYASRGGEGIPRALLEGMACGLPAVATNVAGIPEAVVDGFNGFLVEPRDITTLANRLSTLIADVSLRREMGLRARRHIEEEFSLDVVVHQIAWLLEEVGGVK